MSKHPKCAQCSKEITPNNTMRPVFVQGWDIHMSSARLICELEAPIPFCTTKCFADFLDAQNAYLEDVSKIMEPLPYENQKPN